MNFNNLDSIVRRYLLERGLPIHYYIETLVHGSTAIRELSFDSLPLIQTIKLPVNSYNAIDLPNDFVDDIMLGVQSNDRLIPLDRKGNLNPLRNKDDNGAFIPYTTASANAQQSYGLPAAFIWMWNVNDFGEPTGRMFGAGGSTAGYQVFKERGQIQLSTNSSCDEVVLVYMGDGQSADNATSVDVRAHSAISAYIDWKRSPNSAFKDSGEGRTFYNEKRLCRARLQNYNANDIKQLIRGSYRATAKH